MTGNIVSFYDYDPKPSRRAPDEPATIIVLPVIRIERLPARRRLEEIVSRGTAARVRRELERLHEVQYPADTEPPSGGEDPKGQRP